MLSLSLSLFIYIYIYKREVLALAHVGLIQELMILMKLSL